MALSEAGASTNPLVQFLIAQRATAVSNGDNASVTAIDAQLAALGAVVG